MTLHTVRDEIAKRLKVYRRVYRKRPESYNAVLGIGRLKKERDKLFNGFGVDGKRYADGVVG